MRGKGASRTFSIESPVPARPDTDILIVGGGPVGLLLANLLGRQGVRTLLVEKRTTPPQHSMAIGITPPSLEILRLLELDEVFTEAGLPITRAHVHENGESLGHLDFDHLPSPYRFILSLPQSRTVQLLRANLERYPTVTCWTGWEFLTGQSSADGIHARFARSCPAGSTQASQLQSPDTVPVASEGERHVTAHFLVGCDGHRSQVRVCAGLDTPAKPYPQRFVMADFDDHTDLHDEAHLFFHPLASIESFPLPGGRRRWIVLRPKVEPADPAAYLVDQVQQLTGYDLSGAPQHEISCFGTYRLCVSRYYAGPMLLAGDAAHVMSSIGGQGMNTGFADAQFLAEILPQVLGQPSRAPHCFALYDRLRRTAFNVAANRAARGMWLGTRRGRWASRLRKHFIRDVLLRPRVARRMGPYFAMLTIPHNTWARGNLSEASTVYTS